MGLYADLVGLKGSGAVFDKLIKTNPVIPSQDEIPQDYIDFVREVGIGELGNSNFMLYDGLVSLEEIYENLPSNFESFLIFCDDFSGFISGFRVSDWKVVEIDSTSMEVYVIAPTFQIFIREKIKKLS